MVDRIFKGVYPKGFWALPLTCAKYFFNRSTPFRIKVDEGEKKKKGWLEYASSFDHTIIGLEIEPSSPVSAIYCIYAFKYSYSDISISANSECVHIEPKCVHYGHILVQSAQKTG